MVCPVPRVGCGPCGLRRLVGVGSPFTDTAPVRAWPLLLGGGYVGVAGWNIALLVRTVHGRGSVGGLGTLLGPEETPGREFGSWCGVFLVPLLGLSSNAWPGCLCLGCVVGSRLWGVVVC